MPLVAVQERDTVVDVLKSITTVGWSGAGTVQYKERSEHIANTDI